MHHQSCDVCSSGTVDLRLSLSMYAHRDRRSRTPQRPGLRPAEASGRGLLLWATRSARPWCWPQHRTHLDRRAPSLLRLLASTGTPSLRVNWISIKISMASIVYITRCNAWVANLHPQVHLLHDATFLGELNLGYRRSFQTVVAACRCWRS